MKLTDHHQEWTEYEKLRHKVTNRVTDVAAILSAAAVQDQPDADRIHVCDTSYIIDIFLCFNESIIGILLPISALYYSAMHVVWVLTNIQILTGAESNIEK